MLQGPGKSMTGLQVDGPSKKCALLALPFELRRGIYKHLLPRTVETGHKGTAWIRGNTAIMAANKQIYAEATAVMYGNSTFLLDIEWDRITFAYQWLLPTGLVPKRTLAFPDQLASRNVALIRRLHVRVHHVGSYTGMIKYNYGGHGLTDGVRDQVAALCTLLNNLPEITKLSIELRDGSAIAGLGQRVLEPFLMLKNTREVTVGGSLTPGYAEHILSRLNDAYTRNSFLRFPPEIRDMIYRHLFASNLHHHYSKLGTVCSFDDFTDDPERCVGLRPVELSMVYTCRLVHAEATPVLYRSRYFYINAASQRKWTFGEMPIYVDYKPCHFELPMAASKKHTFFKTRHLFVNLSCWVLLTYGLKDNLILFGKLLQEHPRIDTLTLVFDGGSYEERLWGPIWEISEDCSIRVIMSELLKVRGVGEVKVLGVEDEVAKLFKLLEEPKL